MAKTKQLKAPKIKTGVSTIRIICIALAAIVAIACFIGSIKAGNAVDAVNDKFDQKIKEGNAQSNAEIQALKKQYEADRMAWAEENMPEVLEKYLPEIEKAEADKKAELKGVSDENDIAEITKRYDDKIKTITKAMDSEIDPIFNSQSDITSEFKTQESALRKANNDNTKQLSLMKDEAVIYPMHVNDIFVVLTIIALCVILWIVAGTLAAQGFIKGSTKLLEIVPFVVLGVEVCVVLLAITALSFGDHIPAEFTKDFATYKKLFMAVLK